MFTMHEGLYCYKWLLFRVNSATEIYQHEIATSLAGIDSVDNISDDIIMHDPDQATNDRRLHEVFMGMLVTEKGFELTKDRVKAILEAREPENVSELRSFLGLANYSSRFIHHFTTPTEPLRRLTKKDTPYCMSSVRSKEPHSRQ